jgi:[glutamine synthetase] adenylyltransferase / [glutamine synthetase]-adenylyl-L-tyrosine phosphorylase
LTRARPVAGSPMLAEQVMEVTRDVLTRPRDADRLVVEVADMRRRIAEQHHDPPLWEIKHRRGGLVDIEFMAQYLQLRDAAREPLILRQNTAEAIQTLAAAGALDAGVAEDLRLALRLWQNVQGLIKLTVEEPFDEATAPTALKALLARGAGAIDFTRLKGDMEAAAARVRAHYQALVEAPADAASPANPSTTEQAP